MAMLKGKMAYISQRQSLIAQNVANADTPGYTPRDLKPFAFGDLLGGMSLIIAQPQGASVGAARTNDMHIDIDGPKAATYGAQNKADSEVRLDGNQVVLEDQMVKLSDARMDFDAAVGFYQQSLALLKTALKKPGS
jgi:flagellar basal-body rod protein FlgB